MNDAQAGWWAGAAPTLIMIAVVAGVGQRMNLQGFLLPCGDHPGLTYPLRGPCLTASRICSFSGVIALWFSWPGGFSGLPRN
jgi:hypothetical protein